MSSGIAEGDDWESMLDSGKLDKKLENLQVVNSSANLQLDPFGDPHNPHTAATAAAAIRMHGSGESLTRNIGDPAFSGPVRILTNNGARTQYRRPEPTLKILKRPEPDTSKQTESQVPKSSLKTLEQREAEYAEARQRILGNLEPASAPPAPSSAPKQANSGKQQQQQQQHQHQSGGRRSQADNVHNHNHHNHHSHQSGPPPTKKNVNGDGQQRPLAPLKGNSDAGSKGFQPRR